MSMEQRWWVQCNNCGTRGPEAMISPEARLLATKEGWMVGGKGTGRVREKTDYCQECRMEHEKKICGYESDPGQPKCGMRGMYRLTTVDGGEYTTCGRHLHQVINQLKYANRLPVTLDEVHSE